MLSIAETSVLGFQRVDYSPAWLYFASVAFGVTIQEMYVPYRVWRTETSIFPSNSVHSFTVSESILIELTAVNANFLPVLLGLIVVPASTNGAGSCNNFLSSSPSNTPTGGTFQRSIT